jgi:hypothetical protein
MNRVIPALHGTRSAMRLSNGQMIHLMDALWEKIYYILRNRLNIRGENNDK